LGQLSEEEQNRLKQHLAVCPASEAGRWRAIDVFEGDKIKERARKNLVRAAIDLQTGKIEEESAGWSSKRS